MNYHDKMLRLCAVRDIKIRRLRKQGHTLASIGKMFSMSRQRVWQIVENGK